MKPPPLQTSTPHSSLPQQRALIHKNQDWNSSRINQGWIPRKRGRIILWNLNLSKEGYSQQTFDWEHNFNSKDALSSGTVPSPQLTWILQANPQPPHVGGWNATFISISAVLRIEVSVGGMVNSPCFIVPMLNQWRMGTFGWKVTNRNKHCFLWCCFIFAFESLKGWEMTNNQNFTVTLPIVNFNFTATLPTMRTFSGQL